MRQGATGVIDTKKHAAIVECKELEKTRAGFIIEGERLIKRAIDDGLMLRSVIYSNKSRLEQDGYIEKAKARCGCYRTSEGIIAAVSSSKPVPPEIAACVMPQYNLGELLGGEYASLLITDCVNNPDNLGLVIRTADACGVDAVIVTDKTGRNAAPYHKNCVRAARGAIGRLPVIYEPDGGGVIAELKARGVAVIGADVGADIMLGDFAPPEKFAVVVGNETTGMSREMCAMCDVMLKIGMAQGRQSSFNVAVAAGIILNRLI